jgi:mannose-6-phosphate isomerase-like protein (cupin superfamily)
MVSVMQLLIGAGQFRPPSPGDANDYTEHMSVPDLSVGTYSIPVGGLDDQEPHTEDEIYVVTSGRARIVTPSGAAEIGPGAVIYVPAGEPHQFVDIREDLTLLVVFAPAYTSRA